MGLAALRRVRRASWLVAASSCPHGWIPAFAGMTHVDLVVEMQQLFRALFNPPRHRSARQIDLHDLRLLVGDMINEAGILMAEAVVILPPDMRGQEIVERSDRAPPRDLAGALQPLGVLIEHRIGDMDECLVAGERSVALAGRQASAGGLAGEAARDRQEKAMTDRVAIVDESRSVRTPDLPGGHGSGDYARSATRLPLGGNGSSNERRNRSCARDPPRPKSRSPEDFAIPAPRAAPHGP